MSSNKSIKKKPAPKAKNLRVTLTDVAKRPVRMGGLGRGMDSLIGREVTQGVAIVETPRNPSKPADGRVVFDVDVSSIVPSPWQPRQSFDEDHLRELADSIRTHGIIQPLVCRSLPDGKYELIGGERRLRAAGLLGLLKVPVIVMEAMDHAAAELALVENLQREDLNVIEEAEGYKALSDKFGLTQGDIAERVGKARPSVTNAMRLLDLPDEVKQLLGAGQLSPGHGKVLLSLNDEQQRIEFARQSLSEGLTVRALEKRINSFLTRKPVTPPRYDINTEYTRTLVEKLQSRLGTSVRINPSCTFGNGRHGRGRLEIDYFDNNELTRLLELFGVDVNSLDD